MNSARNSLILCLLFLTCCAPYPLHQRDESRPADLGGYFQGFDGALVLYQLSEDRTFRYNPDRCSNVCCCLHVQNHERFGRSGNRRCSRPDFVLPLGWNRIRDSRVEPGPLLKTAFKTPWSGITRKSPGAWDLKRCSTISDAAGYGNRKVGSQGRPVLAGWHTEDPADEQVEFLKQLYRDDLPFQNARWKPSGRSC